MVFLFSRKSKKLIVVLNNVFSKQKTYALSCTMFKTSLPLPSF